MSAPWPERYVGIPFRRGGTDHRGVFCWGLARLIYRERGGPELAPYGEIDALDDLPAIAAAIAEGRQAGPWCEVAIGDERELDLVLINRPVDGVLLPTHIGIVASPGHLLHVEEGKEVVHATFRDGPTFRADPSLRHMVDSVYRHEALA